MSSNDDAGLKAANYWTTLEDFPVAKMTDYYLNPDSSLSTEQKYEDGVESHFTYIHDPLNPVPTIGGNNLPDSIGGTIPCGPLDQQELNSRKDILVR